MLKTSCAGKMGTTHQPSSRSLTAAVGARSKAAAVGAGSKAAAVGAGSVGANSVAAAVGSTSVASALGAVSGAREARVPSVASADASRNFCRLPGRSSSARSTTPWDWTGLRFESLKASFLRRPSITTFHRSRLWSRECSVASRPLRSTRVKSPCTVHTTPGSIPRARTDNSFCEAPSVNAAPWRVSGAPVLYYTSH